MYTNISVRVKCACVVYGLQCGHVGNPTVDRVNSRSKNFDRRQRLLIDKL